MPLWVKFPLEVATELATPVIDSGASGLVIGSLPVGAALVGDDPSWLLQGALHSPSHFAVMLHTLARVAALNLPCALIAAGGIHTLAQAQAALAAGAIALQLDTVAWVEPTFPGLLAAALKPQM